MTSKINLRDERGFQLIELFTAIVIVGILAAYGYPKLQQGLLKANVRSAVASVIAMHDRARARAVASGRTCKLVLTSGNFKVISSNAVTGATVTWTTQNVASQFGVTITPSRDTLAFDSRGLGTETNSTTIIVYNAALKDTVNITAIGRINH